MDLDFQAETIARAYGQEAPPENGASPGAAIHECGDRVGDCLGALCYVLTDTLIAVCVRAYDGASYLGERLGPGAIPREYLDPDADDEHVSPVRPGGRGKSMDYRRANRGGGASQSLMSDTIDGERLRFIRIPTTNGGGVHREEGDGFADDTDEDLDNVASARGVLDD